MTPRARSIWLVTVGSLLVLIGLGSDHWFGGHGVTGSEYEQAEHATLQVGLGGATLFAIVFAVIALVRGSRLAVHLACALVVLLVVLAIDAAFGHHDPADSLGASFAICSSGCVSLLVGVTAIEPRRPEGWSDDAK
ncbi:MAG TPA: hypothetical protein VMJ10_24765 [Kofleriaceae bacterium]|nr:hypothetical protein [Kofleriaceae bacterium]